jgi:hypothetical protein
MLNPSALLQSPSAACPPCRRALVEEHGEHNWTQVARELGNGRTPAAALRQWALLSFEDQPPPPAAAAAAGGPYLLEDAAGASTGGTATRSGLLNNGHSGAGGAAAAEGKSEGEGLDQQQRLLDLVEQYGQRWEVVAPLLGCTATQVRAWGETEPVDTDRRALLAVACCCVWDVPFHYWCIDWQACRREACLPAGALRLTGTMALSATADAGWR